MCQPECTKYDCKDTSKVHFNRCGKWNSLDMWRCDDLELKEPYEFEKIEKC